MKRWWCKGCFLPCQECKDDYERILGPDHDDFGPLKSKTVDLRKNKTQTDKEFEDELAKADFPDFVEWPERPSKEKTRALCREMLKTTQLYDYFRRRRP